MTQLVENIVVVFIILSYFSQFFFCCMYCFLNKILNTHTHTPQPNILANCSSNESRTPGQKEAYRFLPTSQEEEKPLSAPKPLCQELTGFAIGLWLLPSSYWSALRPCPALRSKTLLISSTIFQVRPVCQELKRQG